MRATSFNAPAHHFPLSTPLFLLSNWAVLDSRKRKSIDANGIVGDLIPWRGQRYYVASEIVYSSQEAIGKEGGPEGFLADCLGKFCAVGARTTERANLHAVCLAARGSQPAV